MEEKLKSNMKSVHALIFCMVMLFHPENNCLHAQKTTSVKESDKSSWFNMGVGSGSFNGPSLGASYSQQSGRRILSWRFMYTGGSDIFGSPETAFDLGMLYGFVAKNRYAMASLSGGLSFVHMGLYEDVYYGYYRNKRKREKKEYITVGLPIEHQLFITPSSSFGLGICLFANVNNKRSFTGALFCVQFGGSR